MTAVPVTVSPRPLSAAPVRVAAPAEPLAAPLAPASSDPVMAPDSLVRSEPPARAGEVEGQAPRNPSLREKVAIAERLMGRKVRYDEAQLQAYLKGLERSLPQDAYDPDGFLANLGVTNVRSGGWTDRNFVETVRTVKDYRPRTTLNGELIGAQQAAFDFAMANPRFFLALTRVANPIIEAKARLDADWKEPFRLRQAPKPTDENPLVRYKDALDKVGAWSWRFGPDFHYGLPVIYDPAKPGYGTYQIARGMGFTDEMARRLGTMSQGIDDNTTPYGKTGPSPFQAMDRHFNLDRKAQDTRLIFAANHLSAAIQLAKVGSFAEAEIELGCGLHSLQDVFAHGQLSPSVHGIIGEYPDDVDLNPVALYDATTATAAYLAAYLEGITKPDTAEAP